MQEEDEESLSTNETSNSEKRRKPQKLSKVRTDFDILEKRRLEDERNRAYEEKSMILEEEKKLFAEAKKIQNVSFEIFDNLSRRLVHSEWYL